MDTREKRLVKRLKMRDEKAFKQLIDENKSLIYNLLFRMLGNSAEAEDLLQEVFITVFKKIDSFNENSALKTWIYTIATNHCINRKKYLKRRKEHKKDSFLEMQKSGRGDFLYAGNSPYTPQQEVEGRQMEKIVQDMILSLEDDYRVVIVLRDIQSLSYDEIETILGVPVGTVKSRLHRARMALKEKLAPFLR